MLADVGSVPDGVATVLAFAIFIVPGFLLRRGYVAARASNRPEADLHVLAEAVTASLLVLVVLWPWRASDFVRWVEAGTVGSHTQGVFWFLVVLLVPTYPAGWLLGCVMDALAGRYRRARAREKPGSRMEHLVGYLDERGVFSSAAPWDDIWDIVIMRKTGQADFLVRVITKTGQTIVGRFGRRSSWVFNSPRPAVYLSAVCVSGDDGVWEDSPHSEGVLIDTTDVAWIEFLSIAGWREQAISHGSGGVARG